MTDKEKLRRLFATRDRQAAQLAMTDAQIAKVGQSYSSGQGYGVNLRVEALRNEVGGARHG